MRAEAMRRLPSGATPLRLHFSGALPAASCGRAAAPVDLGPRTEAPAALAADAASQDAVLAFNVLEYVADHRGALADWFRVLRPGGHLVLAVPHQFLAERKLYPPSRWDAERLRFYTAGSLLAEIEDALDPLSYRLRFLAEDDGGFDYGLAPDRPPRGCDEIVAVIERIARPGYADAVLEPAMARSGAGFFEPVRPPGDHEPVVSIEPAAGIARILVLKLDHRGDFLLAIPAFRTLRAQFPAAEITLACGHWNRAEAESLGLFDRVIGFDLFPEVIGQVLRAYSAETQTARFAALLPGEAFDLAVDLRVHEESRMLLTAIEARYRAGFGGSGRFPFLDIALPFADQTHAGRTFRWLLQAQRFDTRIGTHEGYAIRFAARAHTDLADAILIFGPYEHFEAGSWELEVLIEPADGACELGYDVAIEGGAGIVGFGTLALRPDRHPKVALMLERPVDALELRIMAGPDGSVPAFRFLGVLATRHATVSALHQSEMQVLLATLVGLRLAYPVDAREVGS